MKSKYKLEFNKKYLKDLEKVPQYMQARIYDKISELAIDPRPEYAKKLKGSKNPPLYRIRIDNYRVIYTIKDHILVILVVAVGHRREIYR